jgi:hypothetical protein
MKSGRYVSLGRGRMSATHMKRRRARFERMGPER